MQVVLPRGAAIVRKSFGKRFTLFARLSTDRVRPRLFVGKAEV